MKIFKIIILTLVLLFGFNVFNNKKDSSNNSNILNKPLSKTNIDKHEDKDTKSNNKTQSKKDYNILISSNEYNAVVSLNKDTKEISVDILEDSSKPVISDNYINLTEEEIKYLKENADTILTQLKEGSLSQKYSIVKTMLENYDTDIEISDIISLAIK